MKKKIILKEKLEIDRNIFLNDFKESLTDYFSDEGLSFLETPILLENNLIDFLLLSQEGRLIPVKIMPNNEKDYTLNEFVYDYTILDNKRDKLALHYRNEFIDKKLPLLVKVFIHDDEKDFSLVLTNLNFDIDLYLYSAIKVDEEQRLIIEKLDYKQEKKSELNSFLKIMGENVRSKDSKALKSKDTKDTTKENDTVLEISRIKVDESLIDAVENDLICDISEDENKHIEETKDDLIAGHIDFENMQLSEEELIAFFDLEKKVDSYYNISTQE